MTRKAIASQRRNGTANKLSTADRPAHDWYRFVLSFPPHLVREYLARFGVGRNQRLLDPFCGTGTTLVECKKLGLESVGLEPLPMAHFASCVKTDWTPDPHALVRHAEAIGEATLRRLEAQGIRDNAALLTPPPREVPLRSLLPAQMKLLIEDSISPLPLHKALMLLECMDANSTPAFDAHERLPLAKALVTTIGNLHFGPEVGVGTVKTDVPVVSSWLSCVRRIANPPYS